MLLSLSLPLFEKKKNNKGVNAQKIGGPNDAEGAQGTPIVYASPDSQTFPAYHGTQKHFGVMNFVTGASTDPDEADETDETGGAETRKIKKKENTNPNVQQKKNKKNEK